MFWWFDVWWNASLCLAIQNWRWNKTQKCTVVLLPFMKHTSYSSLACLLQKKWLPLCLNNSCFSVLEEKCGVYSFQESRNISFCFTCSVLPSMKVSFHFLTWQETISCLMKKHLETFSPSYATARDDSLFTQLKASWQRHEHFCFQCCCKVVEWLCHYNYSG